MRRSARATERWTERSFENGHVALATRDWSGTGPDLVLLHGLGPDQRSMESLADALTAKFRVITYDQRGWGASTAGPWTFAAAVDDLSAVVAGYELANPVVVGHSLGGMIALMYGRAHPDAPGVINIDGWGPGTPEQYLGEDPDAVHELHDRLSQLRPDTRLGRVLLAALERTPTARRSKELRDRTVAAVRDLDVLALHRAVDCPVLAFSCTAPPRGITRRMMGRTAVRMGQSFRRGLRQDLDRLCEARPNIRVVEIAAPHVAPSTHPQLVADHIRAFLDPT